MSRDSSGIDRRRVLKGIAAGTATVAAGSGVASADSAPGVRRSVSEEYVEQFADTDTVRGLVAQHQTPLETLADEGFLAQADVDALAFDEVAAGPPEHVPKGSATVTEHVDPEGESTVAAIHVPVESAHGRARLTVVPEQNHAFATLPGAEGGDAFEDVETSGMWCDGNYCDCCECTQYLFWNECHCC